MRYMLPYFHTDNNSVNRRIAMRKLWIIIIIALFACTGTTPTYNKSGVDQRYQAVYNLTQDLSCTDSAVCSSVGIGSKPCGGPWTNLVYSTATVNQEQLTSAVSDLNSYEAGYNQQEGLVSDCGLATPANPSCVNYKCIDLNATP